MKKSPIILGAAACILAIAAAFTTKGSTKVLTYTAGTKFDSGGNCNHVFTACNNNGSHTCFTEGSTKLWTKGCTKTLLTSGS